MSQDWAKMTASDLGRGIGAGEIDPIDLTQSFLDAIKSHAHGQAIYARLTEARAIGEAHAAAQRAKSGTRRSLFDGVPISWKDLFDTAGTATEAGSKLLAGRTPNRDAMVLSNATAAGLVCLGKTHMSELAFSGLGVNPVTQTPPCINDETAAPGGSSSGAAASVAFGLASAGIGSDTGGSVRLPAAWNDLVGLKTTPGRLSNEGVVPLCANFDTVGPLTRSVEDAAQLLALMSGTKPTDLKSADIKDRHFLVCETAALDGCETEVLEAFQKSIKKLNDAGAKVDIQAMPCVGEALSLSGALYAPEAYATWKDEIEANPDVMFDRVRERFRGGASVSAVDHITAWQRLHELRDDYMRQTRKYDAVLVPTTPIRPPNVERLLSDAAYFDEKNLLALRNTRIGNLMGLCGLSLPTERASVGLMMLANPFEEAKLLRIGAAAEGILRG
jgi:aspartyl-tRNA(Asn)/glutamyl-tRNA(Gln) amidotransferase subunit A